MLASNSHKVIHGARTTHDERIRRQMLYYCGVTFKRCHAKCVLSNSE